MNGRQVASAAVLGTAVALFVPVFYDASQMSFGAWKYGSEMSTILSALPVLLAVAAIIILAKPVRNY